MGENPADRVGVRAAPAMPPPVLIFRNSGPALRLATALPGFERATDRFPLAARAQADLGPLPRLVGFSLMKRSAGRRRRRQRLDMESNQLRSGAARRQSRQQQARGRAGRGALVAGGDQLAHWNERKAPRPCGRPAAGAQRRLCTRS